MVNGMPPAPTAAAQPAPVQNTDGNNTEQVVMEVLNAASEQQKKFIAAHLTSEIVDIIAMLTNDPDVRTVLSQYADPAVVLVPMPRDQVMKAMANPGNSAQTPQQRPPVQPGGMRNPPPMG